jgi:hypothetical protein
MLQSSKILKLTKISLIVLIVAFAAWLLDKNFTPRGRLVLFYNFDRQKTAFLKFTGLSESEKTFSEKRWYRRALTSPIEIKLELPRPYKKAKIYLEYQNSSFPIVYLAGIQRTKNLSGEKIKVIENKILDNITWYRLEDKNKNVVLLQKGKDKCEDKLPLNLSLINEEKNSLPLKKGKLEKDLTYEDCQYKYSQDKNPQELTKPGNQEKKPWREYQFENVIDFLKNISPVIQKNNVAVFNYSLLPHLRIENYQPENETPLNPLLQKEKIGEFTFEKTIRDKHQILTYIKNEHLDFTFYFQDLNRKKGADYFHIFLKQDNKIIAHYFSRDDGNTSKNYKKSQEKKIVVKKENLPEGLYQLILDINSDLIVKKITTKQKYFAFQNSLQLFDPGQNLEFYTNATNINFAPLHKESLDQEIKITPTRHFEETAATTAREDTKITTPKTLKIKKLQPYHVNLSGINKIDIQKNDVKIDFNGITAINFETLEKLNFSNLKSLTEISILNNPENVDYIITSYSPPPNKISESWISQEVEFDLTKLGLNPFKPKVSLFLHIPGFDRNVGDFKLRKIHATLEKDPWDFEYLKNVIKTRLKKKN